MKSYSCSWAIYSSSCCPYSFLASMLRGITKGYEETTRYVGGLEGRKRRERDGEGGGGGVNKGTGYEGRVVIHGWTKTQTDRQTHIQTDIPMHRHSTH